MASKEKIKVLYILATNFGGMLHYVIQLSNAVSKYADVIIIGPKNFSYDSFSPSIKIYPLLNANGNLLQRVISLSTLKIIADIKPDIIHVTASHPFIALFLIILRIDQKCAKVYTDHDPNAHIGWKFEEKLGYFLHDHLMKYDMLIVHGKTLKHILVRRGVSPSKIEIIPHGTYSIFNSKNNPNSISPEKNTILFFGRIRKYKGLEYLLKAVPIIIKQVPDLKVIIAGKGDLSRFSFMEYKHVFEIHNEEIPDESVSMLFNRAQFLVLPYLEATQSGPLHIAFEFKKPVIATNVGAIPEVIENGKTGFLVPPRDENALAQAIVKLISNKQLTLKMGQNAYQKTLSDLSWDSIANKTIQVYKKAVCLKRNN
jgi:alpha-maltose-1-phosphate synthase